MGKNIPGLPHGFLVETDWLAAHLHEGGLCIVDTDTLEAYKRSHIPGSVLIPDNYGKDPDGDRVHVLNPSKFSALMESLGIDDDTLVVAYDNSRSLYASRLWWMLNYYGHKRVFVLNGGWRKWCIEQRPISLDLETPRGSGKFHPEVDQSFIIDIDTMKCSYQNDDVVVWDLRSKEEYIGLNARNNLRSGHIPGAIHLEWNESINDIDHTFRELTYIRTMLESKGIIPDKEVLIHCQAGIRASHGVLTLNMLGYPRVRNYDASWKEWGNRNDTPIERGDD